MDKQYFDDWEVEESRLWLINQKEGTKAPVEISSVGWSDNALFPVHVVIYQTDGAPWHSRQLFSDEKSAAAYAKSIPLIGSR